MENEILFNNPNDDDACIIMDAIDAINEELEIAEN
jgi:hypothetical protein